MLRRISRFLGRLGIWGATASLTGVALVGALIFYQGLWWLRRRRLLPPDLAVEIVVVTIIVATPIIAYAQGIIRELVASRETLRALTRDLAEARDTLERKVALRTAELSAANEALEHTVADLRVARDQAQTGNDAKSQFLANMSHELRTPLNAIIGFSEVIRDEVFGAAASEQYREYAGDIHSSGTHLLDIISDVLDMSKIEADKLELHEDEMDVAPVIRSALKFVSQTAAEIGVTLSADVPADLPPLMADELRVKQVLLNLLSNAVKFSNPGGSVTIGAAAGPNGSLAIWVTDTGVGMTEAEIAIAFEPFRQIESSLSRRHDGTGLGLPLTRGLMELHGGSLKLTSVPGVGTTATVHFPAARVLPQSLPATESAVQAVR